MQLARFDLIHKTNVTLTSAVRNSSCSHGWLRFVVQCVFFALTVTSFILILLVSLSTYWRTNSSRCQINGCRVVCAQTPVNAEFENDIIYAVTEAKTRCEWVVLTLNEPFFHDSTLPPHWLSRMRKEIHELAIIGGNLRNISPQAFMAQFNGNIRCLVLEKITITSWDPHTLVGLSSLKELIVKDVNIHHIERNALEAVDDTLKTLTVTGSGSWNPKNLTGSAHFDRLTTVDFSTNLFSYVIGQESFTSLQYCQVLYLNSCSIKAIGTGAFDNLANIKILYLNNNLLVTVPIGLFENISSNVKLRIHLQDNRWLCDCALPDLQQISDNDMMLVDPTCYYPEHLRGKSLREFYDECANKTIIENNVNYMNNSKYISINGSCDTKEYKLSPLRVISPVDAYPCPKSMLRGVDLHILKYIMESTDSEIYSDSLKPTFAIRTAGLSMVEITSRKFNHDFGILWYQTKCPHEIYCLNILPNVLRVYNIDNSSLYTFCPLQLGSGSIQGDECILYNSRHEKLKYEPWTLFYILTAIASLVIGALFVFLIIRQFPSLLKGSKRILFVKHKNVEALVLPPKIPLRTKLDEKSLPELNNTLNFLAVGDNKNEYLAGSNFKRTMSMTSTKSNAPSYISALHPTEDQLIDWRLRHHFDDHAITSISSYVTDESSLYCSLDEFSNKI